nr:hypothetical protein [Chitinophagaceae bacterium]
MNKLTLSLLCFSFLFLFSCKKENIDTANDPVNAAKIINIDNNPDFSRVSQGNGFVDFATENSVSSLKGNRTSSTSSTRLVFKGRISALQHNGEPLSAIQVAAFGNLFAVSYLKTGDEFSGGLDVFRLNNGVPQLLSTVKTPDADITSITSGGGKFFIGADLKNFESFNYQAPATVGVVSINGGNLINPQIIPLAGFSVKDLLYHQANQKLYVATSTRGGLSIISFNNNGIGSRTNFTNYDRLRSLAISGNQIIGTTSTEYRNFDLNDGSLVGN